MHPRSLPPFRWFHASSMALLLATTACGFSLRTTALASPTKPLVPRAGSAVDLYVTSRPTVPVRDLAILTVEEASIYAGGTEAMALEQLRDEAGRMGCDGLVLLGPSGGVGSGLDGKNARSLAGLRGACVEYLQIAPDGGAPPK